MKQAKFTLSQYRRNENKNFHSLNALLLVQNFGTKNEVEEIKSINQRHEAVGHLCYEDSLKRYEISNKYFSLLTN